MDKLPYLKSERNKDGVVHPPKVTVDGKVITVCLTGSSKDKVYTNDKCFFAHIFVLESITKGVSNLNKWALGTNGVKWSSQKITAAAAKPKPKVLKEDPIKKMNKVHIYVHNSKINTSQCSIYSNMRLHTCKSPRYGNFKYPIGPCRNTLKLYNHVVCVTKKSVWDKRSTSLKRVNSYHSQGHRVARANHTIQLPCKSTPLRSSNLRVQNI